MRALVLFAALLSGCATTPEVTFLLGPRRSEDTNEVAATIMVLQRIGESRTWCGYVHNSEIAHGVPFNDVPEITFDHVPACGWRWGGQERK